MMFIFSFGLDVQIDLSGIAKRFKEVIKHLCGDIPNIIPFKFYLPYKPGASSKVNGSKMITPIVKCPHDEMMVQKEVFFRVTIRTQPILIRNPDEIIIQQTGY